MSLLAIWLARPGVSLIGIVSVDSIVPSNTKVSAGHGKGTVQLSSMLQVSSIENYVTVTLRLATQPDGQVGFAVARGFVNPVCPHVVRLHSNECHHMKEGSSCIGCVETAHGHCAT